ncbi:ABC transporter substrate-binding protein [Nitratireductor aestuarii]|uniref:ABC transporter substrate-binding protein n=1 Tax=Nitratireductor aestuarii TaxID=1735103 RepID=A0A916RQG4_9HYPH|nr:ABC transporter substrate-binding protein [Nitratireductor aestuarii]GGA63165.1 ABC transporter substrate-binding protein [Nitratireductor aestuarii]
MGKKLFATTALALLTLAAPALAADGVIKIGVLNDQSTSFSALGGSEVVTATELAVKDYGGEALGKKIEIISADHQNKPEVGLSIARQWIEQENVDAIVDMANSAIALGVNTLIGENKRVGLFVSPLTDRPTEADCNGYVTSWAYDAYSTFTSPVKALSADGVKKFFILSPDYEAGKVQEATVEDAINASGGEVMGKVRAPLGTTDFSSYLLQAQSSGAEALILNVNGPELVNAMKQAQEFGLKDQGIRLAAGILHQSDVRAIGVEALQGVQVAVPWFWNLDDNSRKFGEDMKAITGKMPGWVAAGAYSAVSTYLKAVDQAGTDDADKVLEAIRGMEINDMFAHNAKLFPNGRLIHDMFLAEVKAPADVKEGEDYFNLVATVPATEAFKPLSETACPLVNKS